MPTRSKYVRGYGQSLYTKGTSDMWQDAPNWFDPTKCIYFYDDFAPLRQGADSSTDFPGWAVENTGSTVIQGAAVNRLGGYVTLGTGGSADNDTANILLLGSAGAAGAGFWRFDSDKPMWFEACFSVDDIAEMGIFLGLCLAARGELLVDDTLEFDATNYSGVGFEMNAADGAALNLVAGDGSGNRTELAAGIQTMTATATTFVTAGWYWNGTTLDYWINNSKVGSVANTNIPAAAASRFTIGIAQKVGTTDAGLLHVDWVRCLQYRS